MTRKVKHDSSVRATTEGPSFGIEVSICNDAPGTVFIRPKTGSNDFDVIYGSRSFLRLPLKDVPALIKELQWVQDLCGEISQY